MWEKIKKYFSIEVPSVVTKWRPFNYYQYGFGHYMIFARLMSNGLIQFKTVKIADTGSNTLPFEIDTCVVLQDLCKIAEDRGITVKKSGKIIKLCRKDEE